MLIERLPAGLEVQGMRDILTKIVREHRFGIHLRRTSLRIAVSPPNARVKVTATVRKSEWSEAAGSMKGRKQYLVTLARIHTKLVVRGSVQVWVEFTKNVRLVTRVVKNITQKCV